LTAASLIHHVVADLLHQHQFAYAHFPELVDLAVVMTGLGTIRSRFEFVKRANIFWDSTYWGVFPRPFLDTPSLGYAHAVAAWIRADRDPSWFADLPTAVKTPSKKSLKFLTKTGDSFFDSQSAGSRLLQQDQRQWLALAGEKSTSKQIIALLHFEPDESLGDQQEKILLERLRSSNVALILHAISAVESLKLSSEPVVDQLQFLTAHASDQARAKAAIALAKLGKVDQDTVGAATKMIDSSVKHVVYAGVFALASQPKVEDATLRAVDRGFLSALQTCDYEFIQLFVMAYVKWLEQPETHFQKLLGQDSEYLEMATDALQAAREQSVALR
jgi:hypothetical protein